MSIEQELKEIGRIKQELFKDSKKTINHLVAFVLSERIDECLSGNSPEEGRVTFLECCRDRALRDASPTLDMKTKKEEPKVEVMFFATFRTNEGVKFGAYSPALKELSKLKDWLDKTVERINKEISSAILEDVKIIKL